ncbi:MAG: protein-glutamate O-methyltransferase CheR [Dehalococcoidia bacterium]|nr:protein-glutamate O-methyltransferase CheR [Dehalococcoidia bacterium]
MNMCDAVNDGDVIALNGLLKKVHRDGGYDFRGYKKGIVERRLQRRMHAVGAKIYPEYMRFLDDHPEEYHKLVEDLTIKVSSFFREPYAFQQITRLVLPELVSYKRKQGDRQLKIWSTACARGEEPYSMAILLSEFLGDEVRDFDISIYATDISWYSLGQARVGVYPPEELESLPAAVRRCYFTRRPGGCGVTDDIKKMLHFSRFDLSSPGQTPFTKLDAILCCNILIYLQKPLQEKILGMLYDALAAQGYMILGRAETLTGNLYGKMECLDSLARIYRKK